MKDFEILRAVEQIRALAHGQRLDLLRHLVDQPLTATMVARLVERPVNQVHYHIRNLLEAGLVEEVADAQGDRKDERFYRATARQFLVEPNLTGAGDPISQSVRRSVEITALHARRQILDLELSRIAQRVVTDCLGLRKDDRVLVVFAPTALDLVEAILVELDAVGAEARPRVWSRNVILQTLDRHGPDRLAKLPFLHPGLDRDLDATIFVTCSIPQGAPPNEEQREKLPYVLDALTHWQESLLERKIRSVEIALPHRGEFEGGWASPEDAIDTYWTCLNADPAELARNGAQTLHALRDEPRWSLHDARGTDLTFDVEPGTLHVMDGLLTAEDVQSGKVSEVLPAGQLAARPVSESANGVLCADYTSLGARHFYDVRMEIRRGRIVQASSRGDEGELLEAIRNESGDPDLIAGISVGLNPGGSTLTGRPSLDAALLGVVNVSFGNNEIDGGKVRSTLTLNLPSRSMSLRGGNTTAVQDGRLLLLEER